ncbi:helix-turn-helix domain-containing protein [Haloplanus aerogenes]|uniref:Transposase n=1 Tax=Haloplanus aerogenes TaxID=660522 RepID=A0A3G8QVD0_9EURY|nr:transposase [Haloplanus aerogenes]
MTHRWAHAWNDGGVDGLWPSFGGRPPPKLTAAQFEELCGILEAGQPWTPRLIHALIEERYGVTYHPAHLSRKLRGAGMKYAKPRPLDPASRPCRGDARRAPRAGARRGRR